MPKKPCGCNENTPVLRVRVEHAPKPSSLIGTLSNLVVMGCVIVLTGHIVSESNADAARWRP